MTKTHKFQLPSLLAAVTIGMVSIATVTVPPALAENTGSVKESKSLELESVVQDLNEAQQRQVVLKKEIAALDRDVGAINRALIEAARSGQSLEDAITETEKKLDTLLKSQIGLRNSLNNKRELMGEVLAALQRMGTNPPPALLVKPEDALTSIRSAILLGAVVPQIRSETEDLLAELTALREISKAVDTEKGKLKRDLNALAEDETRLSLLVEEKQQLATQSRNDLVNERNRAIRLGERATSLKELISDLESQIASASAAANAAKAADDSRKRRELERLAAVRSKLQSGETVVNQSTLIPDSYNPARNEPAIAFSRAKGTLLRPASGEELYGFGARLDGQTRSQGMAIMTRANARVRSPTDGWVVYAGPFRSYGQILILNAGEGYHLVLSGLSEVNVETGRFVLAGEPVGRMGLARFAAAIPRDLGSNNPVLTVELRKDGKTINPAPWWAVRNTAGNQVSPEGGT
ncbi:MAG: murein hydrolase activator EnvC family protein [Rhizobiaceae bacterium]